MLAAGDSTGAAGAWAGRGVGDVVVWGGGQCFEHPHVRSLCTNPAHPVWFGLNFLAGPSNPRSFNSHLHPL